MFLQLRHLSSFASPSILLYFPQQFCLFYFGTEGYPEDRHNMGDWISPNYNQYFYDIIKGEVTNHPIEKLSVLSFELDILPMQAMLAKSGSLAQDDVLELNRRSIQIANITTDTSRTPIILYVGYPRLSYKDKGFYDEKLKQVPVIVQARFLHHLDYISESRLLHYEGPFWHQVENELYWAASDFENLDIASLYTLQHISFVVDLNVDVSTLEKIVNSKFILDGGVATLKPDDTK